MCIVGTIITKYYTWGVSRYTYLELFSFECVSLHWKTVNIIGTFHISSTYYHLGVWWEGEYCTYLFSKIKIRFKHYDQCLFLPGCRIFKQFLFIFNLPKVGKFLLLLFPSSFGSDFFNFVFFLFSTKVLLLIFSDLVQRSYEWFFPI